MHPTSFGLASNFETYVSKASIAATIHIDKDEHSGVSLDACCRVLTTDELTQRTLMCSSIGLGPRVHTLMYSSIKLSPRVCTLMYSSIRLSPRVRTLMHSSNRLRPRVRTLMCSSIRLGARVQESMTQSNRCFGYDSSTHCHGVVYKGIPHCTQIYL